MGESPIAGRIRDGLERFNEGDFAALLPDLTEDFELHRRIGGPEDGVVIHGREAFVRWLEPDAFESMTVEVRELHEREGRVLVVSETTAVGAGSGVEVTLTTCALYEHDGERSHRLTLFADRAEAEAALGSSE